MSEGFGRMTVSEVDAHFPDWFHNLIHKAVWLIFYFFDQSIFIHFFSSCSS